MKRAVIAFWVFGACGGSTPQAKEPLEVEDRKVETEPTEEPEDDMQIEGTKGTLDVAAAQRTIEGRFDELVGCWQEEARGKRWLGGHVELKFRVNRDGTVKRVHVIQSDLGSWAIEKCLVARSSTLAFTKPEGGEAEITFPFDFPVQTKIKQLDEEQAAKELAKAWKTLGECEAAPASVQITVWVGPGGAVKSAGFAAGEAEPFDEAWAECALEKALAWKLTDPRGVVTKATAAWKP
jgi:TonB family protein